MDSTRKTERRVLFGRAPRRGPTAGIAGCVVCYAHGKLRRKIEARVLEKSVFATEGHCSKHADRVALIAAVVSFGGRDARS